VDLSLLESEDDPEGNRQHEDHYDEGSSHAAAVVDTLDVSVLPNDVAWLGRLLELRVDAVEQVSLREVHRGVLLVLSCLFGILQSEGLVVIASESDEGAHWLHDVLDVRSFNASSNLIFVGLDFVEVEVDDGSSSQLQQVDDLVVHVSKLNVKHFDLSVEFVLFLLLVVRMSVLEFLNVIGKLRQNLFDVVVEPLLEVENL